MTRGRVAVLARYLFVLLLIGTAGAKFLGGPVDGSLLGAWRLHYFAIGAELAVSGALCFGKLRTLGCTVAIAMFAGGALTEVISSRPCGCFGARVHVSMAGH